MIIPRRKGKGEAAPFGEYAKSRVQFSSVHENYVPKFNEIFKYALDGSLPSFGYRDETDCLTYHWESSYLGTIVEALWRQASGRKGIVETYPPLQEPPSSAQRRRRDGLSHPERYHQDGLVELVYVLIHELVYALYA